MCEFTSEVLAPILSSIRSCKDRNAFVINDKAYTYRLFGECVSKIRNEVHCKEINNQIAGLVINDDIETYASIIALWLEGKSYVPLHPNWPMERITDILEQVEVGIILDSSDHTRYGNYPTLATSKLEFKSEYLTVNDSIADNELAYILFTSGSTGKPKGVQITRKNIAAFMNSFWQTGIDITSEDRCLQCFDLTFDVSVQGYLVSLTRGACCYTVPYGGVKYILAGSLIEEHKLTFGAMAPSMLRYLRPYFSEMDVSSLRYCILTAEGCPIELMDEWRKYAVNATLYDFYGATEATVYSTYYRLNKDSADKTLNGIVSIGKPLANVSVIIVDEELNMVVRGRRGELCISGDQVTPGYWKNPTQNGRAFFYKEINGESIRFYRTGDLCYMDEDGDIMYSGRIDQQAKIQGFRVELGEIEYHAREFLKGINAVCIAFSNIHGLTEIAMFIESAEFDTSELMTFMHSRMPSYMIPTRIQFVASFPLNANDKIDKNKLKESIYVK